MVCASSIRLCPPTSLYSQDRTELQHMTAPRSQEGELEFEALSLSYMLLDATG